MNIYKTTLIIMVLGLLPLLTPNASQAQLAIVENTPYETYKAVDSIEDEALRTIMMSAIMPGYGQDVWNLDSMDEADKNEFFAAYEAYPLTMEEKLENVEYIIANTPNMAKLAIEDLEYKDIIFGEAVIPIPDRRVGAIANQDFLLDYSETLEAEKQAAMQAAVDSGEGDLQSIEDEYATKQLTLSATENEFKNVKLKYVNLENQLKHGRIQQEAFNQAVRELVTEFENFTSLGSEKALFDAAALRGITEKIYEPLVVNTGAAPAVEAPAAGIAAWAYKVGALILFLLAAGLLVWALKKKSKK